METVLSIGLSNALAATLLALLAAVVGCFCRRPAVMHSLWLLVLLKLLVPSPLFVRPPWPAAESASVASADTPERITLAADPATIPAPAIEDDFPAADDPVVASTEEAAPTLPAAAQTTQPRLASTPAVWPWKSIIAAVW